MLASSPQDQSATSLRQLVFVSGNPDKRRDASAILPSTNKFSLKLIDHDLKEIQGDEDEIARDKCTLAMQMFENDIIIVEDTSLRFDQFGGMPGPYIKHFNRTIGAEGLYRILHSYDNKKATVRSTVAIGLPAALSYNGRKQILIVSNDSEGEIVFPRGNRGDKYGWDPCFKPSGSDVTLGEMCDDERKKYCSRVGALSKASELLQRCLLTPN